MVTGVLFLVPVSQRVFDFSNLHFHLPFSTEANIQSGMAAAGGLAMTRSGNHDDSYSQGLVIAFRMITVAIGITVSSLFFPARF